MTKIIKETQLYQKIRNGLTNHLVHLCRLENAFEPGMPDILGCYNGVYFLIELKIAIRNMAMLRPAQVHWMNKHVTMSKGNVFLCTYVPDTAAIRLMKWDTMPRELAFDGKYFLVPVDLGVGQIKPPYNWQDFIKLLVGNQV